MEVTQGMQSKVLAILRENSDEFLTARQIAIKAEIPSDKVDREVREIIRVLRLRGEPIISNGFGFSVTRDITVLDKNIYNLQERATAILKTAEGLELARNRILARMDSKEFAQSLTLKKENMVDWGVR